jgi:hypothetical protein
MTPDKLARALSSSFRSASAVSRSPLPSACAHGQINTKYRRTCTIGTCKPREHVRAQLAVQPGARDERLVRPKTHLFLGFLPERLLSLDALLQLGALLLEHFDVALALLERLCRDLLCLLRIRHLARPLGGPRLMPAASSLASSRASGAPSGRAPPAKAAPPAPRRARAHVARITSSVSAESCLRWSIILAARLLRWGRVPLYAKNA